MTRGRCSKVKLRHVREKLAFSRMSRARASILGAHMRKSEDVSSGSAPRACQISCKTCFSRMSRARASILGAQMRKVRMSRVAGVCLGCLA